jgi:xanthine dehydrogenase accessory factor
VLVDPAAPDQESGDQLPALVETAWNEAVAATSQEHLAILCLVPQRDRDSGDPFSMVEVFMLWCGPPAEAWIFGAGHIGLVLTPILSQLGWRVVICDDRPEFVTVARFPDAHQRRVDDFAIAGRACASRPDVWAVLVTRGHQHDEQILRELRAGRPRYVGMIGSRRRVITVRKRLAADGASPHLLEILHSPIGLPIGAESPMEIAVSIAAEMVSVRRGTAIRSLPPGTASAGSADASGQIELWEQISKVREAGRPAVLATVVGRRGSTPRGPGAQMAIYADGTTMGTIGGGCGEGTVLRVAKELIAGQITYRRVDLDLAGDIETETTDICGGHYSVFLELLN